MLRMILAGAAAVAIGTIGGFTLVAAMPARDSAPLVQLARTATETVAPSPKKADFAPVVAPERTAEAAPPPPVAPAPKAQSVPSPEAAPADATPDKPEIRFDGDRVSVRFGKFKIDL
jgi:hypothetical protein